jgi:hypothetical protein
MIKFYLNSFQAGTVVGFFNGLHIELEDTLKNPELEMTPYKVWNDWDDKEALLTLPKGISFLQMCFKALLTMTDSNTIKKYCNNAHLLIGIILGKHKMITIN